MTEDDCNAGAIFDNLKSDLWDTEKYAVELICDAVPVQNIQVMIFQSNLEKAKETDNGVEVCTNYRYMKRQAELKQ